jgi:hypothetical protein
MQTVELLRTDAEEAYAALQRALAGVSEGEAWAAISLQGAAYLHSPGSILGIVQHVATCKVMYASAAFRGLEVRWRDCADRIEALGSDWPASLAYLEESQVYWMASWATLLPEELEAPRRTNWGEEWPAWRIFWTMTEHDIHHGAEIGALRDLLRVTGGVVPATAT